MTKLLSKVEGTELQILETGDKPPRFEVWLGKKRLAEFVDSQDALLFSRCKSDQIDFEEAVELFESNQRVLERRIQRLQEDNSNLEDRVGELQKQLAEKEYLLSNAMNEVASKESVSKETAPREKSSGRKTQKSD